MSGSDPPESHRGNGTPATRSIRVCLGTMIRRIADCLLERLPRLCSVHDDPVSVHDDPVYGISINVQVLYRGYASRARKLRRYALWCLVLTFVTYLYIFGGSVLITLEYQERAKKDIDQSLERATQTEDFQSALNDVARSSHKTEVVVAVGEDGAVLVSGDSGRNWVEVESGTLHDLYSVAFSSDGKTVIASGDSGTVLVSEDFGWSWDVKESGTRKDLNKIVLDENGATGIAAGDDGRILVSSDGGVSWNELNDVTPEAKDLNGLALSRDGRVAVAVGDDRTVMVSHGNDGSLHGDRGSWSSNSVDNGDPKIDFNAVAFGSGGKGVLVGDDKTIFVFSRNVNGERNLDFEKIDTGDTTGRSRRMDFEAVAFSGDDRTAIAVGGRRNRGIVWAYDGENESWREGASDIGDRLNAVALDEEGGRAVAVGRDGAILVSTDHGKGWHSRGAGTASELHAVTLDKKGMVAIAVGERGTILRSESSSKGVFLEFESITPRRQDSSPVSTETVFFTGLVYRNVLLIGPILVLILVVRYLVVLTRYNLRLAAFYDARGDAILFSLPARESADTPHRLGDEGGAPSSPDGGAGPSQSQHSGEKADFPRPKDIDELERLMRAVSPDDLDFGRTPKTTIEEVARLAKVIVGRRKKG